jgi:hypothetical protein
LCVMQKSIQQSGCHGGVTCPIQNKNQSRRRTFCVEVERKKMPDPEEDPHGPSAQKSAFKPVDSDQFQVGTRNGGSCCLEK